MAIHIAHIADKGFSHILKNDNEESELLEEFVVGGKKDIKGQVFSLIKFTFNLPSGITKCP